MMISPNCPEHGRLVLDLALGRLDDDTAVTAEEIRESCPVCRDWWQAQFVRDEVILVDEAVASVFGSLELPARRRNRGWLAVAAAAVMTIGVGALWMARDPLPVEPVSVERSAAIQMMDFEIPALVPMPTATSADLQEESTAPSPIFVPEKVQVENDGGNMIASATPPEETAGKEETLFVGGFESGTIAGWGAASS